MPDNTRSISSAGNRLLLAGRAGSGKSRRLMKEFVSAIAGGGEDGLLLVVPTASYRDHTRNRVLRGEFAAAHSVRGFSGQSIGTFRDLLARWAPPPGTVSGARRELLVRRLLDSVPLPSFQGVAHFPGFRAALADACDEAWRAGAGAPVLRRALGSLPPPQADFVRFLEGYEAALAAAGADEYAAAEAAVAALRKAGPRFRLLLVDGFADFTRDQRLLLEELMARSAAVRVALTVGAADPRLFYQSARSRAWLLERGFREQAQPGNQRTSADTLLAVESMLSEGAAGRLPVLPLFAGQSPLTLLAAADRRDEAEWIAREILRLVRAGECRYREIGVIARQPSEYLPLLRDVFRRLGLPLRAFFPLPLLETAAGRHFRLCLDLFRPELRPHSVVEWLKSPYAPPLSRDNVDRFESRAMARLAEAQRGEWDGVLGRDERLAVALSPVLGSIARLERSAGGEQALEQWAGWLRRAWAGLVSERSIPAAVTPERALELRAEAAALVRVPELIDEIEDAAASEGGARCPFSEFQQFVIGLAGAESVPLRDRRQDAVNLMSPFEARQWELRVVFVPGLIEKEFPRGPRDALFLADEHRERLAASAGIALPTTAERAADERLLFYVAATRARERLYLSYPQSDAAGRKLLPSFFLRDLAPLLKPEVCARVERKRSEVTPPLPLAANQADLLATTHALLAYRPPAGTSRLTAEEQMGAALYERLAAGGRTRDALASSGPRPGSLRVDKALTWLRGETVSFSVSRFESFAACAFQHFMKHTLKLKDYSAGDELDPLREGTIVHETIARWSGSGGATPIAGVLETVFAEKTATLEATHVSAKAKAEMRAALEAFAAAEAERPEIYRTEVRPEFIEVKFGLQKAADPEKPGWPPLLLELETDVTVRVEGRIDRIEVARAAGGEVGLLVDYKYSQTGFDDALWRAIQEGRKLQLPVYLLVLREILGLRPGGAELYPLKGDKAGRSGMYDESLVRVIAKASPGAHVIPHGEFEAILEASRAHMRRYAQQIRSGVIEVSQTESDRCKYCDYSDVCRVGKAQIEEAQRQAQGRG